MVHIFVTFSLVSLKLYHFIGRWCEYFAKINKDKIKNNNKMWLTSRSCVECRKMTSNVYENWSQNSRRLPSIFTDFKLFLDILRCSIIWQPYRNYVYCSMCSILLVRIIFVSFRICLINKDIESYIQKHPGKCNCKLILLSCNAFGTIF